jgi:hypothetical protein
MEKQKEDKATEKVVILHGFEHEQIFAIMKAIKRELGPKEDIAFAMTTPNSLQMQLQAVVKDVAEEHAYLKKHPPGRPPQNSSELEK